MVTTVTFICGCGHSGTTLLANMFAAHPATFVPLVETGMFLKQERADRRWPRLLKRATASGRPHLVEKTPRHIHRLDRIRRMVPEARFVMMVRDGRDVAASFVRRYGSAAQGIARWIEENAIVRREMDAADATVLAYEALIADPEAELRRVCAFAGIPFDPAMLRYHEVPRMWFRETALRKGTGAEGPEHAALRNWQVNQPLFDGRGAWRTLDPSALAPLREPPADALMRAFGYDPDEGFPPPAA